jgi:hypothetical protein
MGRIWVSHTFLVVHQLSNQMHSPPGRVTSAEKQMHHQRREEARDLMKWIQEKNNEAEPGRKVSELLLLGFKVL